MPDNSNIGYAFPLEKLGSDISRNNYNYQSILNGLIEWNNTNQETVNIRLTKDTDPWFEDYQIPSKKSVLDMGSFNCSIEDIVKSDMFAIDCTLDASMYGGSKLFTTSSVDTSTGVNTTTGSITLDNVENFSVGDVIKVESGIGGDLPDPLDSTTRYYIVSLSVNDITISTTPEGSPVDITTTGTGTFNVIQKPYNYLPDTSDSGDILTIRTSVKNAGNAEWVLYYGSVIQEWASNITLKANNIAIYNGVYYKINFDVENSTVAPDTDTANFEELIKVWDEAGEGSYRMGDLVLDGNNVYLTIQTHSPSILRPSSPNNTGNFELYAKQYINNKNYSKGEFVYDSGRFFVAKTTIIDSIVSPLADMNDNWEENILFEIPTATEFNNSAVFRWTATTNTSKILARNASEIDSNDNVNINLRLSIKTTEPASIYQKSIEVFPTSNYSLWPQDKNAIWSSTGTLGPTDESISITKRQNYSAAMIFDHTRPDIAKTVNYLNYNGPDLDQGLCIYLPVEIDVGDGGIAYPEDGYTFDFFFRIWPDASLNDQTTRDHIVNKSQIYVYSAQDRESIISDTCEEPIAKFSMARLTNYYMFGENTSIPDKPVCIRATFKYSHADRKWCTFDYYQLPDHIFIGPVGFIDPQNPANLDINDEVMNNINPNASNIGYETAAFPMFQDPFSNPNLTPFRYTGNKDDNFKNRIVQ